MTIQLPEDIERAHKDLISILSDIPWNAWETILRNEPEWYTMLPFLGKIGFGPFSVLMVTLGLNDYQLKGKAEKVYWPILAKILQESPPFANREGLIAILEPFYQKERLATNKVDRLHRFLKSRLAEGLWVAKHQEVANNFRDIWFHLASTMGQEPEKKTISFAMKCLGICLIMVGEYNFDFEAIPIPVDSRIMNFTRSTRIASTYSEKEIRDIWHKILYTVQQSTPSLTMIHLDSLIWQIGNLQDYELKKYIDALNISEPGIRLINLLQIYCMAMYGICNDCENFITSGNGEAACDLGHEIVKDREECDDFTDYTGVSGEGTWSLD